MMDKETIKEFFKLTKWKIYISIIFCTLAIFILATYGMCIGCPSNLILDTLLYGLSLPLILLILLWSSLFAALPKIFSIFLGFITTVIYWYFLSCIVIFVWNNLRRGKSRNLDETLSTKDKVKIGLAILIAVIIFICALLFFF